MLIRCPGCRNIFKTKDYVVIDETNGLTHSHCLTEKTMLLGIKDWGTFIEIKKTYPFFGPTADLKRIK